MVESVTSAAAYIPRVYFTDSNGDAVTSIYNAGGNPQYKYYYAHASDLVNAMAQAKEHFAS